MSLLTQAYLLEKYGPRLNMEQLGEALGIAVSTLHKRIGSRDIDLPTYIDGKLRFADAADVAEYLDRKRKEARLAA